jgi:glucan-binding YG repeat protein
MKTGWLRDTDGKWYFLETRHNGHFGAMLCNTTTPDGYRVDANGAWIA